MEVRDYLEDLGVRVGGKIILRWTLKQNGIVLISSAYDADPWQAVFNTVTS